MEPATVISERVATVHVSSIPRLVRPHRTCLHRSNHCPIAPSCAPQATPNGARRASISNPEGPSRRLVGGGGKRWLGRPWWLARVAGDIQGTFSGLKVGGSWQHRGRESSVLRASHLRAVGKKEKIKNKIHRRFCAGFFFFFFLFF